MKKKDLTFFSVFFRRNVPHEIKKEWGDHVGNDLGREIIPHTIDPNVQFFVKPLNQVGPSTVCSPGSSAATGDATNVNQKIETPTATETLFERVSAPFDLEDVVGDIIANAPVVIDDSSNNNGDSAFTNVPLVQENFENPIVSHNQVSGPSTTTVDATDIMYDPKKINSPTTEPEKLHQVDNINDFDILQYRDSLNESGQFDLENNFTDDMLYNAIIDDVDPNFFNDF